MPIPGSPADVGRETAERKWAETWSCSEVRVRKRRYEMPGKMRGDPGTEATSGAISSA